MPARFRRPRVLIVGCGDVGLRAAGQLGAPDGGRVRLLALTSSPERVRLLRACGITPLTGDLDRPETLRRLSGLAQRVLHLAPPPGDVRGVGITNQRETTLLWHRRTGAPLHPAIVWQDRRTEALCQALQAQGVDILVSCEQGVCGTCLTRVLEGQCDHRDHYLTDEEKAAHDQFTPCCSRARSPLLVLDL